MVDCNLNSLQYWVCYQPDPRSNAEDIYSGLRHTPQHSCQYWIKGLPGVCKYWNEDDGCTFNTEFGSPTGYSNGECDGLGRRSACNKYDNDGEENLDEYHCVAPCMERSGVGRQVPNATVPLFTSVPKEDILGYNDDKCDGLGLGRGSAGESKELSEILTLKRICNYYRPYNMGFGFTEPQQLIRNSDGSIDLEAMEAVVMDELQKRLPFQFKVYNLRAKSQRCAHWSEPYGSEFIVGSAAEDGIVLSATFDGNGKVVECTCDDDAVNPYRTRDLDADTLSIVKRVWSSEGNCVVCNGAKPECPRYTGDWKFCTDEKMSPGYSITAEQILELRFWIRSWVSQEEYDNYFENLPNPNDPTTADIYTFDKWIRASSLDSSLMIGKRVHMCMPAPPGAREFIPDIYLTYEDVKYPPVGSYYQSSSPTGTTTKEQVSYTTLIRDLSELNPITLDILYPYSTRDPFYYLDETQLGCNGGTPKDPCIKRSCEIGNDEISVVGFTIASKKIICYNKLFVDKQLSYIDNYDSVGHFLNKEPKHEEKFYKDMLEYLDYLRESDTNNDLLYESYSDSVGTFKIGPVKLEYQQLNTIVIILDLSEETVGFGGQKYEFKKIDVWSQWHGGVAIQSAYTRELEANTTYINNGDELVTPPGAADVVVTPLQGGNSYNLVTEVASCNMVSELDKLGLVTDYTRYNYCIKMQAVPIAEASKWFRVGNDGSVWLEIEDMALNCVFDWGVSGAYMDMYEISEEGEVVLVESVEMEKVFPTGSHTQKNIPRNAAILKPKDGVKRWFKVFGLDKSILRVWYYFTYVDDNTTVTDNEVVLWPNLDSEAVRFSSPTQDITQITPADSPVDGTVFNIDGIQRETVRILVLFKDDDGAIVSSIATKLLVNIPQVYSRSVEIRYSWYSSGTHYRLEPAYGFTEHIEQPTNLGPISYNSTPLCGDHETTFLMDVGPMWYPYKSCETFGAYDIYLVTHYCTMPYNDVPRYDMRAKGPDKFHALFLGVGGASACSNDYVYGYDVMTQPAGSALFQGYANVVPAVNSTYYQMMGWPLPPFGNSSRDYVGRFFSTDRVAYAASTGAGLEFRTRWLPKVPDKTDFNFTFNSYDKSSYSFTDVSQFNYLLSMDLSETIDYSNRYRFEEVFSVRKEARVSYPEPAIEDEDHGTPFKCFYKFIDEAVTWAWREQWEDIERDINNSNKLKFISLTRPDYFFDMYKNEHRRIISEGEHTVTFSPPLIEDGIMKTYPSLKLDSGPERYFDIIYNTYDSDSVDWMDENSGIVDGSSDGGNIYEKTSDINNWYDDPGRLLDSEATDDYETAEAVGRIIKMSYDSLTEIWQKGVYNRGVTAYIQRNRLKYMPYESTNWAVDSFIFSPNNSQLDACGNSQGESRWILQDGTICTALMADYGCPTKLVFLGVKGAYPCTDAVDGNLSYINICKPGVEVKCNSRTVAETSYELPTDYEIRNKKTSTYRFELVIYPDPNVMIDPQLTVEIIFSLPTGYRALINNEDSIKLEKGEYVEATEHIYVWERRYIVSKGSDMGNFNPNGPQEILKPSFGFEMGGIYWPPWDDRAGDLAASDKLRSVYGKQYHADREPLNVGTGAQILTKEETFQREVYDDAYNSETTRGDIKYFRHMLPPEVQSFFDDINGVYMYLSTMVCKSDKFAWANNAITLDYNEVESWQPEGHVFAWDVDNVVLMRCLERDYLRKIFRVKFVHRHGGSEWYEPPQNAFGAYSGYAKTGYYVGKEITDMAQGIRG